MVYKYLRYLFIKQRANRKVRTLLHIINNNVLVLQLGLDKLAVEACDVGKRNALGALGGTSTGIGTVT